ncbi:MAG: RidA family protein [Paracoccaceae bacterium]|jgi:enamine deaminase RidA (YjgF/YER057c/UK114 family)
MNPSLSPERIALEMGLDIPDFTANGYYGAEYGTMKPFHLIGNLLFLSGHVGQKTDGSVLSGRLGDDLTTEQGYGAARVTGQNLLGGIRQAVGSLDRVKSIVRTLNFVVCTPAFKDVNQVSSGLSDLLVEVFGREKGLGGRATIGVMALAGGNCFETWATVELTP